jgi:hypothetical protein
MEVVQSELEAQTSTEPTSINVSNLTYMPSRKLFKKYLEYIRYELTLVNLAWLLPFYKGEHRKMLLLGAPLRNISFKALSGELTAILGDETERREIIELMTGRKKSGTFDGSISLCGENIAPKSYYYDHVAFVQKVCSATISTATFHSRALTLSPFCSHRNLSSFPVLPTWT